MNTDVLDLKQEGVASRVHLLELLKEILGVEPEDLTASFYDYGGDSLLLLIYVTRVGELGDVDLSNVDIDGTDALELLLQRLENAFEGVGRPGNDADPRKRTPNLGEAVPVTANRYSYLSKMGVDAEVWSLSSQVYHLDHQPSVEELERIALQLTERHDGLRLNLWCEDGAWRQEMGAGRVEVRAARYSGELAGLSYDRFLSSEIDKARGELGLTKLKAILLLITSSTRDGAHLAVVFHHAVIDGISLAVIERDIFGALLEGVETFPKSTLSASYSSYAADHLRRCEQL